MNFLTKLNLLSHFLKWRLTWNRRDTRYRFVVKDNPKFMGPRDAAKLICDGAVIANSGLGGSQRASIMYWAIRELFEETGHPCNITLMSAGGHGGRGRAPGTVEEYGQPGLTTRFISGHLETFKSFLKLGEEGICEIQCLPQGIMAFLFEAQGRGEDSLLSSTGIGTFIDPRVGTASQITASHASHLVEVEGDRLRYRIPKIGVAIFNAPAADREGNLYVKNCAMIAESYEASIAAKKNGGIVIANVGLIVEKGYDSVFLPADMVDAIVYYPKTEQTLSVYHNKPWLMVTPASDLSPTEGISRLRFICKAVGVTPKRSSVDEALARLASDIFIRNTGKGAYVNIGIGLPEEVCRLIFENGRSSEMTFVLESGVIGGLPGPGPFFGISVCPEKIMSSAEIFKLCYEKLDAAILGCLQVDSDGNVNVSKRGRDILNCVGPGGFIDFTTAAKTIIFVTSWMVHSKMVIKEGKLKIIKSGTPKFVDKVDEITFNGRLAVKAGKKVFYVTNTGVFELTMRGMELIRVMPGIDIEKDIIDNTNMKVILPESGNIAIVDPSIVTGEGFKLI